MFEDLFHKIAVVIISTVITLTSIFTGQKPVSIPSPFPIIEQHIQATSTPSAIPKEKVIITPKSASTPRPTPKSEEVTCLKEEVIAEMEKAGITVSEEQITRNQSSCNLDKEREWSIKNTVPLKSGN